MGILLVMEFLWHWRMQAHGEGIMEAVSWLQFPSRSDYFSFIWWLLLSWLPCKNTHSLRVNQIFAWVGPMPYCIACLIEGLFLDMWNAAEKSSIWFQIASVSPRMLYNAIKHLVRVRQLGQVEQNMTTYPKTVCRHFPLLMKFEYL